MRILFVGDIMGRAGREAIQHFIPRLRQEHRLDWVVANAENAAGGRGVTPPIAQTLFQSGIDVITMGNHTWDRPEIESILADDRVIRPANYPPILAGHGDAVFQVGGKTLGIVQVMGRHTLAEIDCPFRTMDAVLGKMKADVVLVDMHAEATSEKEAMGWYLDGRVAAVLGTHTHVQTADERILPGGTAYITDAGMTGPRDSVIGGKIEIALKRFLTGIPLRVDVADGDAQFNGCVLDLDEKTGKARSIERLFLLMERAKAEKPA
ncbi:MAG TPA: TIGR00282 family metallophosphoesterase [Elusimicrobiota bacterium]|nr:TIGR00282 family metallophosphoesterase [Elusimicrobiota bacterium]